MRRHGRFVTTVFLMMVAARAAASSDVITEWNGWLDIPDIIEPPGISLDLQVDPDPNGQNILTDIELGFLIPHTWQGDLIIHLEHVDSGRFLRLLDRPGSTDTNRYGYSADNYGDPTTRELFILDDDAEFPYDRPYVEGQGIPNVTGNWQPDTDPLAGFAGVNIVGTWRLWIADQGGGDIGHVERVVLFMHTIPSPGALATALAALLLRTTRRRPSQ